MSTQTDLVAHTHGIVDNIGTLVVDNEIACQCDRFLGPVGIFSVVTSVGMGSDQLSTKAALNGHSNVASLTFNLVQLFDNVFIVIVTDENGDPIDPSEFWFSFERIPRVGV